jgi:ketosteroid isomerase-like protein
VIHRITAEDDRVAVEAESFATHVSGKPYNNKYHFLMRYRDGKLLEFKEYMDTELVTDVLCGGRRPD